MGYALCLLDAAKRLQSESRKRTSIFFSGADGSESKGHLKVGENCRKNGESERLSGAINKTGRLRRKHFYI